MNENPFSNTAGSSPASTAAATDLRTAAGDFAKVAGEQVAQVKERAYEAAQSLKHSALEKAEHYKTIATEKAEHLRAVATEKTAHAREAAQHQWEETRVRAKELHITAEDYIRQNPTKSVLGALGIGFLIGLVLRR